MIYVCIVCISVLYVLSLCVIIMVEHCNVSVTQLHAEVNIKHASIQCVVPVCYGRRSDMSWLCNPNKSAGLRHAGSCHAFKTTIPVSSEMYIYGTSLVNKHCDHFWSRDYIVSLVTDIFLTMGLWLSKLVGALSSLAGSDRHVRILMLGLDAAGNISITQYKYIFNYIEIRWWFKLIGVLILNMCFSQ